MDDRGQTNGAGKYNETNGPGNENVTAPGQHTDDFRCVELLVFDEELSVEDKCPQEWHEIENCFEKQKQTG